MFGGGAGSSSFSFNFQTTESGEIVALGLLSPQNQGDQGQTPSPTVRPAIEIDPSATENVEFSGHLFEEVETIEIGSEENGNKRTIQKHRIISDEELSNTLNSLPPSSQIKDKEMEEKAEIIGTSEVSKVLGHSDLVPNVYEGGFKVWECAVDLLYFLAEFPGDTCRGKKVLELGCGHAFPGIYLALLGAEVHFQDYNSEVLSLITIPNVKLNIDLQDAVPKLRFFAGDWGQMAALLKGHQYDYIITSDTLYKTENLPRLYNLIKSTLKQPAGIAYVAAKTYYFSVGGGCRQFETVVREDDALQIDNSKLIKDGSSNVREILRLRWKGS